MFAIFSHLLVCYLIWVIVFYMFYILFVLQFLPFRKVLIFLIFTWYQMFWRNSCIFSPIIILIFNYQNNKYYQKPRKYRNSWRRILKLLLISPARYNYPLTFWCNTVPDFFFLILIFIVHLFYPNLDHSIHNVL